MAAHHVSLPLTVPTRLTHDAAEIAQLLGVGTRTIWRWVSSGVFPQPDLRVGPRIVKWRRETVLAWIEQQAAESAR